MDAFFENAVMGDDVAGVAGGKQHLDFRAVCICAMIWFKSIGCGSITCFREKASSCLVRSAALSAAFMTTSSVERTALCGSDVSMSSSMLPRMAVSRLLKSWATPPASRPMDSIFWAC